MSMHLGKGVKAEKAEKYLAKADPLVEGEALWLYAKCNNLRPVMDAIVVTNARVLGLSTVDGWKYRAPVTEIVSCDYDPKKKTVSVTTTDGRELTFKSVAEEDVPVVQHYLEYARQNRAPDAVFEAIAAAGDTGSSVLAFSAESHDDYKAAAKEQKRAAKRDEKERKAEEKAAQEAADNERAGALVETGVFGMKTINIYQNGYVRLGLISASKAQLERLVSIEASSDVSKKSGVGRGAAAVMTLGVNLASSNKRGDVYLTIVTDRNTYALHEDPPTASNLKNSKKLEAAGNAVIRAAAGRSAAEMPVDAGVPAVQPAASGGGSIADRIRELKAMHEEGLITDDEFTEMRSKLLGSL